MSFWKYKSITLYNWHLWFNEVALSNLSDVKDEIFQESEVNIIAADALATCVARTSAAMLLINQLLVFQGKGF